MGCHHSFSLIPSSTSFQLVCSSFAFVLGPGDDRAVYSKLLGSERKFDIEDCLVAAVN